MVEKLGIGMSIKHALIVDDSKSARMMLKRLLQKVELTADTVNNAEEALQYLELRQPDIIFMDHMMPGMDGLMATKTIKQNPKTTAIPTVMCTSKNNDSQYLSEAKEHGAIDVLEKPATFSGIKSILERIVIQRPSTLDSAAVAASTSTARPTTISRSTPVAPPPAGIDKTEVTRIAQLAADNAIKTALQESLTQYSTKGMLQTQISELKTDVHNMMQSLNDEIKHQSSDQINGAIQHQLPQELQALENRINESFEQKLLEQVYKTNQTISEISNKISKENNNKVLDELNEQIDIVEDGAKRGASSARLTGILALLVAIVSTALHFVPLPF